MSSLQLKNPPRFTDVLQRSRSRVRFGSVEVVLVVIGLSALYLFGIQRNGGMADFAVNFRAGQRILHGEPLYQIADGHYMFKYLPPAALIYAPFTVLPIKLAMPIWFLLSLGALAAVFATVDRLLVRPRMAWSLTVAGAILAKYLLHELRLGQINIFVTLTMLASLEALLGSPAWRAEIMSGALAGLAVAMKPHAALLVLYFAVTLRWRSVAAALAVLALCLVLPSAFYGVAGNFSQLGEWASTLSQSTPALLTNADNVSVLAFFAKWLGDAQRAALSAALTLAALAGLTMAVIVAGWRWRDACVLDGALMLTLIPLVSPLGWDYQFLMALLAVTLIVSYRAVFAPPIQWLLAANFAVVALVLYDIVGRVAYGTFMHWSVTTINFCVVVLALAHLRFRRVC